MPETMSKLIHKRRR